MVQALLGTFFTWAMTAAGAALVFIFSSGQVSRFVCKDPPVTFGTGPLPHSAGSGHTGRRMLPDFLVFSVSLLGQGIGTH